RKAQRRDLNPCGCKGLKARHLFDSFIYKPAHHTSRIDKQKRIPPKPPRLRQSPLTASGSHPKSAYRQNPTEANEAAEFHTLHHNPKVGITCLIYIETTADLFHP